MDIRTLCLGVLTLGESTGYEIKKMFEDGPFSHFYEAGFGSIYPSLNRLTDEKLLQCTELAQDKRPDKKVYSITPEGRQVFAHEIRKPPGRDRLRSEFLVAITFSGFLTSDQLAQVIDDRIGLHHRHLAQLAEISRTQCGGDNAVRQFTVGYGAALHSAAVDYLVANRHLIENSPPPAEKAAE